MPEGARMTGRQAILLAAASLLAIAAGAAAAIGYALAKGSEL